MLTKSAPSREAGGYQYLTDVFEVVHVTSSPLTDQQALDDFPMVNRWFEHQNVRVTYITRREMESSDYKMMPFQYDPETKEVNPIVRSGA